MSNINLGIDREYYLRSNPDVALSGRDPVEHYLEIGWKEGRDPSDYFSTAGYLAANPDVAAAEINPLQHFLTSGLAEGRMGWRKGGGTDQSASELIWGIDKDYYLRNNPDVALSGRDPAKHYLEIGWKEGRDPSDYFSTAGYLAANPDVAAAKINPLQHFLTSGLAEGRTGWRKRSVEELHVLTTRVLETVRDRIQAPETKDLGEWMNEDALELPDSSVPIPLTPRALRIFCRVTRISRD